jgi:nitrite reductase/ring-hydroxylating ferredoxin subunit
LGSQELSKGEVKYVNLHGENMAVFRGDDGIVYSWDAYCAHLGANLGVNGTVVHDRCIQCPFHAWVFDGKTGNCVIGKEFKPKEAIKYEYVFNDLSSEASNISSNITNNNENLKYDNEEKNNSKNKKAKISISQEATEQHGETCTLKEKSKGIVKIRKFPVLERSGSIFIWFDASAMLKFKETYENEIITEFPYEPFDISHFQKKLEYRGTSLNTVKAHVQDIAENGGDLLHFLYVHNELIPYILKGYWDAKWISAADPELTAKIYIKNNQQFHKARMDLIDMFINDKNKNYIGIITLENSIQIIGIPKQFEFFSLTGFQVGPGIVYLFLNSPFFNVVFIQYIESKDKITQNLYHDIFSNRYLPYWFTALLLRMEVAQVLNDGLIWDNKKFAINPTFNLINPADKTLILWRNWYSQFYKDCRKYEEEKRKENLDW